tara:strand:- start:77 stop:373 length:297 start_codon:yes stop_codon:yes gene_type:complete
MKNKKFHFIFLTIPLTLFICHPLIAENNEQFFNNLIRLRESKFGKDEQYLNKLSDCRMIADNFLKIKKEEDNFNKRVWAVSNCMKDYEAIMEVKKMIK